MRARSLVLAGWCVAVLAAAVGAVVWQLVPDGDDASLPAIVLGGATGAVPVILAGFLAGWFGRERDDVVLLTVGLGLGAVVAFAVGAFLLEEWRIASVLIGVAIAVVTGVVAQATWRVGNAICDLRGLPTMNHLLSPAFPDEYPGEEPWTTGARQALDATLDALVERCAPGVPVEARAIGIVLGLPRDRPAAVVLAGRRLAIQQVDLEGVPIAEPATIDGDELAEVCIPSQAADGSVRRQVNAYDDVIDLRTTDGRRVRLRLAYDTRGAGTAGGGPAAIRSWLRTSAARYR